MHRELDVIASLLETAGAIAELTEGDQPEIQLDIIARFIFDSGYEDLTAPSAKAKVELAVRQGNQKNWVQTMNHWDPQDPLPPCPRCSGRMEAWDAWLVTGESCESCNWTSTEGSGVLI